MPHVAATTKAWMELNAASRRSTSRGRGSISEANMAAREFLRAHEGKDLKSMSTEDVARLNSPRGDNGSGGRWRRLSLQNAAASLFTKPTESHSRDVSRGRSGPRDRSLPPPLNTRSSSTSRSTSAQRSSSTPRGSMRDLASSSSRAVGAFVKSFSLPVSDSSEEARGSVNNSVDAQIANRLSMRRTLVSGNTRTELIGSDGKRVTSRPRTPPPGSRRAPAFNRTRVEPRDGDRERNINRSVTPSGHMRGLPFNRTRTESTESDTPSTVNSPKTPPPEVSSLPFTKAGTESPESDCPLTAISPTTPTAGVFSLPFSRARTYSTESDTAAATNSPKTPLSGVFSLPFSKTIVDTTESNTAAAPNSPKTPPSAVFSLPLTKSKADATGSDKTSTANSLKAPSSGVFSLPTMRPPRPESRSMDSISRGVDSSATDDACEVRSYVSEGIKVFTDAGRSGELLEDFGPRRRSTDALRTLKPKRTTSRHGKRRTSVGEKLLSSNPNGIPLTLSFSPRRTSTNSNLSDTDEFALGSSDHSIKNAQDLFPKKKEEVLEDQYVKGLLFLAPDRDASSIRRISSVKNEKLS